MAKNKKWQVTGSNLLGKSLAKKRGQVTIFIIVGVVIVAGLILGFLLFSWPSKESPSSQGSSNFIRSCVEDIVRDSAWKFLYGGGSLDPQKSVMYLGKNYTFLCYQADNYLPCYNLYPGLGEKIESNMQEDTVESVEQCFEVFKQDSEDVGFYVELGTMKYSIDLLPGKIRINLQRDLTISREGSSQKFENFDTQVLSSLYELVNIARDIVNDESKFCTFEYVGYMLLYPDYDIRRINYDSNRIYKLISRKTSEEFKFAVRGCTYPPGI